jgi:integrase
VPSGRPRCGAGSTTIPGRWSPGRRSSGTDVRPPQVGQAERLIDTAMAQNPELGLFLVLAVVLGARRGEVCRLRWSHVDLDRGEVLVGGKITSLPGELRDEEWTKTRSKAPCGYRAGGGRAAARPPAGAGQAGARRRGQSLARRLCV